MSGEERTIIDDSLRSMIQCLDSAAHLSSDPPDAPPLQPSVHVHTGNVGRPTIHIPPGTLATALGFRGPTHLASVFNCSARTVRRRALEYGLAEPGPPVYVEYEHDDGTTFKFYGGGNDPISTLSDNDLDEITSQIVEIFPNFGRRMIDGHLQHLGHRVPRSRIQASYSHVHGAPASSFGPRRIQRRVYSVPGPNSLAHHDGQHGMLISFTIMSTPFDMFIMTGLIRWKIVFHGFVDGFSRLVTGIRASNNNRAETVFALFQDLIEVHGLPSRIRGDHGVENGIVARYMEIVRGALRGSYIWGRSVTLYYRKRSTPDNILGAFTISELNASGVI